ncbi:MAG: TIGR03086 family protein, partial [Nocardioides sp.]
IGSWAVELSTHAWDLAVATGRTAGLDESLAAAVLPIAQGYLPRARPEGVPFGPVVETGADAAAYDRLVAWQGRDPGWRPA